ncbi:Ribosomal protein S19, mitochondrial [Linum grandiflorum]
MLLASIRRKVFNSSVINHGVADVCAGARGNPVYTWPLSDLVSARCKVSSGYGFSRLFSSAAEGSETKAPMARAMWKGPFVDAFLLKLKNKGEPLANRKIWSRRSVILPEFLNSTVRIYNGKTFVRCKITEGKVGHKFGEFALTRRRKKMRGSDPKASKKLKAGKK